MAAIAAGRRGDPEGLPELRRLIADPSTPRVVRASAARLLEMYPGLVEEDLLSLLNHDDDLIGRQAAGNLWLLTGETADEVLHGAILSGSPALAERAARAALAGWQRVRGNRSLLEAVILTLTARVESVPEDDSAWFLLGAAHQIAGNRREAIRAYERKLSLDPYAKLVRKACERLRAEVEEEDR